MTSLFMARKCLIANQKFLSIHLYLFNPDIALCLSSLQISLIHYFVNYWRLMCAPHSMQTAIIARKRRMSFACSICLHCLNMSAPSISSASVQASMHWRYDLNGTTSAISCSLTESTATSFIHRIEPLKHLDVVVYVNPRLRKNIQILFPQLEYDVNDEQEFLDAFNIHAEWWWGYTRSLSNLCSPIIVGEIIWRSTDDL